jgi:hypothetical protein
VRKKTVGKEENTEIHAPHYTALAYFLIKAEEIVVHCTDSCYCESESKKGGFWLHFGDESWRRK